MEFSIEEADGRGVPCSRKLSLPPGAYDVGRDPAADITLTDVTVSQRHARITVEGGRVAIGDLQSTNGCFFKGQRLSSFDARPGESFFIGRVRFEILSVPEGLTAEIRRQLHAEIVERVNAEEGAPANLDRSSLETATRKVAEEILLQRFGAPGARYLPEMMGDLLGLGPLEPLLSDETVTEILVNGPTSVFVERAGRLERTGLVFLNDRHVRDVMERIVTPLGRRLDEGSPIVDARLKDGSRVNAVIPPLSLSGPLLTIRKFSKKRLTPDDLVRLGAASPDMIDFLRDSVAGKKNMVVSGGTGSGKTTLLNILSSFIPSHERIITVEDAAELKLNQSHVVSLETRAANVEGKGEVTIRDLVGNCLRMRPDRIVVGECRGGEALDMLQAMNTGHDGSLTTAHANTPADLLRRLETMVLMAGVDLPLRAVREQIASAVHIVVQQSRLPDGRRKITSICRIEGLTGEAIGLKELFRYEPQDDRFVNVQ